MDGGRRTGHHRKLDAQLVLIGIQARTDSTRLPNKVMLPVGGKTLLEKVSDECQDAALYLNRNMDRYRAIVRTAVLVPHNDPLLNERRLEKYTLIDFPKVADDDVLSRYVTAARASNANIIVRVTADCLFLKSYLISRHIKEALFNGYDYVSNVLIRSYREGMDVEVISAGLLEWLSHSAKAPDERQHVTIKLQDVANIPKQFRVHHVLNDVDDSHLKTSIDTREDYDRALAELESLKSKREQAILWGHSAS